MYAEIVYPLADLRSFLAEPPPQVSRPTWPFPGTEEFVRSCGPIKHKARGGHPLWADEKHYCDARTAIKLPDLREHLLGRELGSEKHIIRLRCAFRRLFSDGGAVVRGEVGIVGACAVQPNPQNVLRGEEFTKVIRDFLNVNAAISGTGNEHGLLRLVDLGDALARFYFRATIPTKFMTTCADSEQFIRAGEPIIFVENLGTPDDKTWSPPFEIVMGCGTSYLWFKWLKLEHHRIGVWYLHPHTRAYGRIIRTAIIRMHAEYQTLRLVLRSIIDGRLSYIVRTDGANRLDRYLNNTIRLINRTKWAPADQASLISTISAYAICHHDEHQLLLAGLKNARRQIRTKVSELVAKQRENNPQVNIQYLEAGGDISNVNAINGVNSPSPDREVLGEVANRWLWKRSGWPSRWVQNHLTGWNHEEWLRLLRKLEKSRYWPMDIEAIGNTLTDLRSKFECEGRHQKEDNLRRWIKSGWPWGWVHHHRDGWNHQDWMMLLAKVQKSEFWPMDTNEIGHVLEKIHRKIQRLEL